MTRILAVDPSSTAFGLFDGERAHTILAPANIPRPERLAMLYRGYSSFLTMHGPYDFVVYEEQFARGDAATRATYGAVGIVEGCSGAEAGVMPLPQSTIKEWAREKTAWAGGKNMKREEVKQMYSIIAATLASRFDFKTQDEKDAACFYYYVKEKGIIE